MKIQEQFAGAGEVAATVAKSASLREILQEEGLNAHLRAAGHGMKPEELPRQDAQKALPHSPLASGP